jgi:arabinogalactan oligomer/maltooligosaccharide transport system substrate-binding protein
MMSNRFKILALAGSLAMVAGTAVPVAAETELTLWTTEEAGPLEFVEGLTAAYEEANPDVSITTIFHAPENMVNDVLTAALGGQAPDLLWTQADHVGPLTAAGQIVPLDDLVDVEAYVSAAVDVVTVDDQVWGVPNSFGNALMLYYNKDIIAEPPVNTDELIELAVANTDVDNDKYGLVYDQTQSFWLSPWLGGFGASVFDEDLNPALGSDAMVDALSFLQELKWTHGVMPVDANYDTANALFVGGDAPMIINGDWELGNYVGTFGDSLGIAPIPEVVGGDWPAPWLSGKYLMVPSAAAEDEGKAAVVADLIDFINNTENQLAMVEELARIPGNAEAIADPVVADDPIIAGIAAAASNGTQQPINLEMNCAWDAMTNGLVTLYASADSVPAEVAAGLKSALEDAVAPGGACGPE